MRGQTTLDFAVGVSLFLLALMAVFLFIPGTIGPFVQGGQEEIVSSNRVASSLSEGLLGDAATPHILDTACTVDFFGGAAATGCNFGSGTLTESLGLTDRQRVNVTLQANLSADGDGADILCWDGSGFHEVDVGCSGGTNVVMSRGEAAPTAFGTAVTARRIVSVNQTQVTLLVEMW